MEEKPKIKNKEIEISNRFVLSCRIDSVKKAISNILGVRPIRFKVINLRKDTATKEQRIFWTTKGIKVNLINKIDLFGFSLTILFLINCASLFKYFS